MIEVLQHWQEVEQATDFLKQKALPTHLTIQKNWDHFLLYQVLAKVDRHAPILDLGCGDRCTLDFLASLGFTDLQGIDLSLKDPSDSLPYNLIEGDLTQTPFPPHAYEVAVSISVIEHGVDLAAFFQEANRILKPGGLLFVTTDYWQTKRSIDQSIKPFGLTWTIFSQTEIEAAIELANRYGFSLQHSTEIPTCTDTPVAWYDKHYTFIALLFRKEN